MDPTAKVDPTWQCWLFPGPNSLFPWQKCNKVSGNYKPTNANTHGRTAI